MAIINLPKKVYMNIAIAQHGLAEIPKLEAIDMLLHHINENEIHIYFDEVVEGIDSSEMIGEIRDNTDDIVDFIVLDESKVTVVTGQKTLRSGHVFSKGKEEIFFISVSHFSKGSNTYYIPDEGRIRMQSANLHFKKFYFDRDELQNFIKKTSVNDKNKSVNHIKKKVSAVSKDQDLRVLALKFWLGGKAGMEITNDSQFQDCYVKIGSYTQDVLWKSLQGIDRQLFKTGKQDFFKNQDIIEFRTGTGKNRN